jgi:polyribonucleotide 5'-hydroxyl-kinase
MDSSFSNSVEKKKWTLERETEFRFEVAEGSNVKIKLVEGFAECFGAEIAKGKEYAFSNCNSCIFTWQGCTIEVDGSCKAYIGKQTPMTLYGNAHCILQKMRGEALEGKTVGPKILIVGSQDSGKSSLCKLLCNYASRMGEQPTFVDLDIGQGLISVPGMLAAIPVERPIDPEDGFGISQPIVQFFGEITPAKNTKFYLEQIRNLTRACHARFEQNTEAAASGMIVNTCGWVDGDGYKILLDVIEIFAPTVVFVLGNEKLYSSLTDEEKVKNVQDMKLVNLPKSGGVVNRDPNWRRTSRKSKIKEYFYGPSYDLCPRQLVIHFKDVQIFRIIASKEAPSSMLPLGTETTLGEIKPFKVLPSHELRYVIVGVSYAKKVEELLECNIAGLLHITDINFEAETITALSPCLGPIPGEFLIVSSIKYMETD